MLIQLPSGSPDQPGPQNADQTTTSFEAGLRRDLASSPVVSYDAVLGGVVKRAIDLVLALATAPLWTPLMLLVAAWAKLRDRAPVFVAQDCIGYGGRWFKCYALRVAPMKTAEHEAGAAANDANTTRAVAELLGKSEDSLYQLLRRLRLDLKRCVEQELAGEGGSMP